MDIAIPLNKKLNKSYTAALRCPVEVTLDMIGGKWKGVILYHLMDRRFRFSELHRQLSGITQRMLTKQLRELEGAGLISRTVHAEVPPRVEYALRPLGGSMRPVIKQLCEWGADWLSRRL